MRRERGIVTSYEFRVSSGRFLLAPRASRLATRTAITLIEILISMFVLLFGLMGVAAIFPVANHYLVQGDQKARSDQLASNAFAQIEALGIMNPETWLYGAAVQPPTATAATNPFQFIRSRTAPSPGTFGVPIPPVTNPNNSHPGFVFVIDPMGTAAGISGGVLQIDVFPYGAQNLVPSFSNPWLNPSSGFLGLAGNRFPVRRVTLPAFDPNLAFATPDKVKPILINGAETIFSLRDDLAVELPDESDRPAIQRWSTVDINPATGNPNNTPNDPSDDMLLTRQYKGDYSWLATVVPTNYQALLGMQPAERYTDHLYDVSVVVFHKRDFLPSASASGISGSERLISAEFLNQGELAIYSTNANNSQAQDEVDLAVDDIRATNWLCVMGVNQINGQFLMKWYRILAMDEETEQLITNTGTNADGKQGRLLMVTDGGDWPLGPLDNNGFPRGWQNLQVAILPGAIHVQTRVLPLGL